ncbi:MAG: hypothetical protein FJ272_11100, partial [Planctomycetes bacterium]|nr:hypothetical protein [Planctomycetota bacterium]
VLGKCLERPNVQSKLNQLLAEAVKAAAGDEAVLKRIKRDQDYFMWCWEGTHQEYLSKRPRETYAGKCTGKVAVDGKFDDEDWKKVDFTTHFIVNDGKTLADPQTYVKMLYDADHLYFAVDAMEPQRDKSKRLDAKTRIELRAACVARDGPQIWADSTLEFFIAVPEMKGQYYQIAVNPIGTIYDSLCSPSQAADLTFDSKAEVKATVLPDRWTVEARIPTAALGRRIQDGETWKVNVGRSRKLTDGTRQASSWSNGAFHGPDAYRPVVFGGTPLIKNGDFEDVVKASEKVKNPAWQFADDLAPAHWSFTERGTGAVIVGDAASGRRFYRGQGWIFQLVNLSADFRGRLLIRLKTRGKGSLRIAFFQYDRKTSRILGVAPVRTEQVDSPSWSPIEATHDCADDKVLRLAFRLQDDLALDDVSVTPDKRAVAEP